jgi:hypothetical protein
MPNTLFAHEKIKVSLVEQFEIDLNNQEEEEKKLPTEED